MVKINLRQPTIKNTKTGKYQNVPTTGLFIDNIGAEPHTDWLDGIYKRRSS